MSLFQSPDLQRDRERERGDVDDEGHDLQEYDQCNMLAHIRIDT